MSIPALPAWLPDLTLLDLRLGAHTLRPALLARGRYHPFEVLRGDPALVQTRAAGELRRQLRDGGAA